MNKKIILTIFMLFLFGCQEWPGDKRLAQFKDSPVSTLILSNDMFDKETGERPTSVNWTNKGYLSVTGTGNTWSPIFAVKIPELFIVSTPTNLLSAPMKISPDGRYFISFAPEDDLWGISSLTDLLTSGEITRIYSFPSVKNDISAFEWSRDSRNLAKISVDGKSSMTLQVYNLPSHTLRTVFEYVEYSKDTRLYLPNGNNGGLSWSADGERFAFSVQYHTDTGKDQRIIQSDLFIYNIEQNKLIKVTSTPDMNEFYPSWYPKNSILMFVTGNDANGQINGRLSFLANDGECIRVLPDYEGISFPSWSPDGKQIAYLSSDGIEFLDVAKTIPPEYLSPDTLCKISDGTGE